MSSTTTDPWLASAHRLQTARDRLHTLHGDVDGLCARARALAAASDWQSSALDRYRAAVDELRQRLDRLADGIQIADHNLEWEQQRLRSASQRYDG